MPADNALVSNGDFDNFGSAAVKSAYMHMQHRLVILEKENIALTAELNATK